MISHFINIFDCIIRKNKEKLHRLSLFLALPIHTIKVRNRFENFEKFFKVHLGSRKIGKNSCLYLTRKYTYFHHFRNIMPFKKYGQKKDTVLRLGKAVR